MWTPWTGNQRNLKYRTEIHIIKHPTKRSVKQRTSYHKSIPQRKAKLYPTHLSHGVQAEVTLRLHRIVHRGGIERFVLPGLVDALEEVDAHLFSGHFASRFWNTCGVLIVTRWGSWGTCPGPLVKITNSCKCDTSLLDLYFPCSSSWTTTRQIMKLF